jgi:hypothetical protein
MKRRRVKADYRRSTNVKLDEEVRITLIEARQFRADLASLPARFPRP